MGSGTGANVEKHTNYLIKGILLARVLVSNAKYQLFLKRKGIETAIITTLIAALCVTIKRIN